MAQRSSSIQSLLDGTRQLGPFALKERLGQGGFAPVWRAEERYGTTEPVRTAAVKLFALGGSPEVDGPSSQAAARRDRIVAEARALCKVEHPSVVRFFTLPIDAEHGVMGLAMEYVAGTSLSQTLASCGRLSVAKTIAVGISIASALDAVHRATLVHRDVKPANVIESNGVYKLIDFGIAAAEAPADPEMPDDDDAPGRGRLSDPGSITGALDGGARTVRVAGRWGTPGYVDPVCVTMGEVATSASDLYALGVLLYECLAGKVPAAVGAPPGRLFRTQVLDGLVAPPPLCEVAPDTPEELGKIVDELLAPARRDRPRSAELVATRLQHVRGRLAGHGRPLPPENVGPFRGLGRFETDDRDVYFGRRGEVAVALETMRSRGLTALVGPSGSGKSSLARAGVLPAIAEGALEVWPPVWETAIVEPGRDPRAAVVAAVTRAVPDAASRSADALIQALAERARSVGKGIVLFVDQLEQLASVQDQDSKAWLVALLVRLADNALEGVRVLVAVRRDLLDQILAIRELGRAVGRGIVLVEPISVSTWDHVLEHALGAYGYAFEDDALREEILQDIAKIAEKMPLVQFALTEIWKRRESPPKPRRITRAALVQIGGIAGALDWHADAALAGIKDADAGLTDAAARSLLLALTRPDGTRRTRKTEELVDVAGPASARMIEAFEEARLLERSAEGVTLAHDGLLVYWRKLRGWVADARNDRRLAEELERDADEWNKDPEGGRLWQKRRILLAEDLRDRGVVPLSAVAASFLDASRRARDAERNRIFWLAGSSVAALLLIAAGGVAWSVSTTVQKKALEVAFAREKRARGGEQRTHRKLEAAIAEVERKRDRLERANEANTATNEKLTATNKKLVDANRDLRNLALQIRRISLTQARSEGEKQELQVKIDEALHAADNPEPPVFKE